MKTPCFVFIIFTFGINLLFSRENEYQRNSLIREDSELTIETGLQIWQEDINPVKLYNIGLNAGIEYTLLSHSVKVSLPYTFSFLSNSDVLNILFYRMGDINLSYEYLKQFSNLNLFFGSFLGIPLTVSNDYAAREAVYSNGEGRHEIGCSFSLTGVRDPIVWDAGLRYTLGLPKKERYTTTWRPGTIQVSAGISDLFNDRFGFSIGISETLIFPRLIGPHAEPNGFTMLTGFKLGTVVLLEHDYLRFSIDSILYPLYQPVVFSVTYGHNFKLHNK
jgi:hypothetical protein